ncbi:MAG: anthranilate synthase component I family protein [Gemmatimonadota bacterium]
MGSSVVVPLSPVPKPLELLTRFASLPALAFLDGASDTADLGRFSYLTADPVATIMAPAAAWEGTRDHLRATIRNDFPHEPLLPPFQGGWIGWLSYELGSAFDRMPRARRDDLHSSDVVLGLYDWVIAWDHQSGNAWLVSSGCDSLGNPDRERAQQRAEEVLTRIRTGSHQPVVPSAVSNGVVAPSGQIRIDAFADAPALLSGDFSPAQYREAVRDIIELIRAGDLFQANLTQRFLAPFAGEPIALYRAMRSLAPAPMAAYLAQADRQILSMSPELFLRLEPRSRALETRPIKGTRPRDGDLVRDRALADELIASEKDRAENVMIVDLLRNDFSRVCTPESVRVPALCRLDSHAAVHHLVSIVTGTLQSGRDAIDAIAATFPGGSITGAPKLRATEVIAELEPVVRGVYCGAIGWLGCDGGMAWSVAIRTITVTSGVAAIHAGGGITALSDPDEEYRETLDKARALVRAVAEVG